MLIFQGPKNIQFSIQVGQNKSDFWHKLGPKKNDSHDFFLVRLLWSENVKVRIGSAVGINPNQYQIGTQML